MNNIVIVTGGSRGIGAATSLLLARQGYKVCINYRSQSEQAEALVADIVAMSGEAISCQADVAQEADVIRLFDQTETQLGAVTHLVNNAGILFRQSRVQDLDVARIQQVLMTNVVGCFLCCREAVRRMTNGGAIVNVSSVASRTGSPNEYVDYAASKGAVDTLTTGLSLEVADQNIRVNGVRPGLIYTDIHADGGEPGRVDRLAPMIPMKRGGTPEEVANAIAWLLSDEASYATGTFIDLAGGR
ncbi:SDR family oxidoreductase [Oceanospirillum sediminis]|uniref:SDR family oxidoreductase n=1 Tax=Oceanospirillum sediminis TaxID=2760088 RepID=A0A839IVK0_9GAMM|nr:SDR family oxidoreductase [Oceanospirillum sediminis]MBB1488978.1 SDR family oxidoreductase [Oceanospirillum sediminis]